MDLFFQHLETIKEFIERLLAFFGIELFPAEEEVEELD